MKVQLIAILISLACIKLTSGSSCSLSTEKQVKFTQYWIAVENGKDQDDDGNPITLNGPKTKTLKDCRGRTIATVSERMYKKCKLEGTCKLADGRVLNHGTSTTCFEVLNQRQFPWGMGSNDNPLALYVSVASNDLPLNTLLKIKELDGKTLPNGKKHNGCVRVDDTCSTCTQSCHLDFFVGTFSNYENGHIPENVRAQKVSTCTLLSYD